MSTFAFAAAYLDSTSNDLIKKQGFEKKDFHMTTCFDTSGSIVEMPIYSFPLKTAVIKAVVEWPVKDDVYLIAELAECEWSSQLNTLMKAYGAIEDLPHNPHITLIKGGAKGTSEHHQGMVGMKLSFDRHVIKSKSR